MDVIEPWRQEPNEAEWCFEGIDRSVDCLIVRHPELGHLCGYVRVPDDHPGFKEGLCVWEDRVSAHGGITWVGELSGREGQWVGFDCGHSGDLVPALVEYLPEWLRQGMRYRDMGYVRAQVEDLSRQVIDLDQMKRHRG